MTPPHLTRALARTRPLARARAPALALALLLLSALQPFSPSALYSAPSSVASQDYLVHVWQTDDGLPQNWVSSIAQTPEGYLWIGTRYGGLARFDGMRFVPFNPQNTPALLDVQVEHLSVDADGRLWIVMGNESITTYQDNTYQLRRAPRTTPRMKPGRVLATRDDGIILAGETSFIAKARLSPDTDAAAWTLVVPRPAIDIDPRTLCAARDGVIWALTTDHKIARLKNDRFELLPPAAVPPSIRNSQFTVHNNEPIASLETQAATAAATNATNANAAAPAATTTAAPPALAPAPATRFIDIDADKTGAIWVATATHLLRWDNEQNHFTDATPAGSPAPRAITQIEFSGDNGLWVLEKDRLRKSLNDRWVTEIADKRLLQHAATGNATLHGDTQGNVWLVAPGHGLWHMKSDGSATLLDENSGLPSTFITCWYQDTEGNIWIGTTGGIARIRESIFTILGHAQGLPGKAVSSVCIDKQGRLWAGTMTGALASLENNHFQQQSLPNTDENDPFAGLTVWPAAADAPAVLSSQASVFSPQTPATANGAAAPTENRTLNTEHTEHTGIAGAAGDTGLWIGSVNHGLMCLHDGQPDIWENWPSVRVLFGDTRGGLWVGPLVGLSCLRDGHIRVYGNAQGFEDTHAIGAMAEDDAGAIWIGTGPGDLWRYDPDTDTFTRHTPPPEWRAGRISAVLPDTTGAIWVGTLGGGLLCYRDGAFTRCTMENGLPDNNITQLLDSGDRYLWAGTYAGIFRASKDELHKAAASKTSATTVRIYGRFDGLPALECSSGFQPDCWRSGDGTLYFSTANGVVAVNPHKITENKIPPTVIIEDFIVDGKRTAFGPMKNEECKMKNGQTAPASSTAGASTTGAAAPHSTFSILHSTLGGGGPAAPIRIGPGQHHVQFQVTAINFTAPDGVRFRVKLDGADTAWRNIDSSRRLIGYGPLPPGSYRFHVIASNNDGVWNETGDTLAFEVLPHYWETPWFKIALPLALLAALVTTIVRATRARYRRRLQQLERQRELERERTRIAQDLHDDLGTSLTQISLLSALATRDQTPPAETRDLITQMDNCSRKMVTALDEIVWAVNPKNDSWYELANYLGFFAEEFFQNTPMHCRLDIPAQIPPLPIPSEVRHHIFLAVKEALNNAARHSGASQVWLRIKTTDTEAIISVEDDGAGFKRDAPPRANADANEGATADANEGATADANEGASADANGGATADANASRPGGGNGLLNMRRRMEQVGGTAAISDGAGARGTVVTFRIPLN